jgi:prophage regulatory protein
MRRIMRLPKVIDATGEGRATIYEKIKQGKFPRPVKLGVKSVGWVEDEIAAYNDERIAERDGRAA